MGVFSFKNNSLESSWMLDGYTTRYTLQGNPTYIYFYFIIITLDY